MPKLCLISTRKIRLAPMTPFAIRRQTMVDTQVRPSDVTSLPIINAMLNVPREQFLPVERAESAYIGENVPLAPGRVLLAPRTIAKMIEVAGVGPQDRVLVVGAGYGYTAAVLARIAEGVVALEEDAAPGQCRRESAGRNRGRPDQRQTDRGLRISWPL